MALGSNLSAKRNNQRRLVSLQLFLSSFGTAARALESMGFMMKYAFTFDVE
jgi:hypothetical protein